MDETNTATNTTTAAQDEYYYGEDDYDDDDLVAILGEDRVEGFRFHLSLMTLTRNEQLVKICFMTFSCFLSILGSSTILLFCRKKLNRLYHRLLFLLSISDLFYSISFIFQPYAVPKHYQVPLGIGSITSCRIVGFFFMTFLLSGCLLNCCLTLYFYMTIVQGKTELYIERNMEKSWYMICSIVPLILTGTGLLKHAIYPDSYNKLCMFDGIPGQLTPVPGFKLALIWFGIVFLSSVIGFRSTYLVYSKVRDRTKRMERYNFENQQQQTNSSLKTGTSEISSRSSATTTGPSSQQHKRVSAVATQAVLYSLAYFNSMIWPSAVAIVSAALSKSSGEFYLLDLALWTFSPLQGFLNFFVYIRPTYIQWRCKYPEKSRLWALWQIWEFDNTFIPRASISQPVLRRQSGRRSLAPWTTPKRYSSTARTSGISSGNNRVFILEGGGDDSSQINNSYNNNSRRSGTINNNDNNLDIVNTMRREDSFNEEKNDHHHHQGLSYSKPPLKLLREEGLVFDDSSEDAPVDSDGIGTLSAVMEEDDNPKVKTTTSTTTTTIPSTTRRSIIDRGTNTDYRSDVRRNSTSISEAVSAFFDLDLEAGAELSSSQFKLKKDEEEEEQQQHRSSPLSGFKLNSNSNKDVAFMFRGGKNRRTKSQPTMLPSTSEEPESSLQSLPNSRTGGNGDDASRIAFSSSRRSSLQSPPNNSGSGDGSRNDFSSRRSSRLSLTRAWSLFWNHEDILEGDVEESLPQSQQTQQHGHGKDMSSNSPNRGGGKLQNCSSTNNEEAYDKEQTLCNHPESTRMCEELNYNNNNKIYHEENVSTTGMIPKEAPIIVVNDDGKIYQTDEDHDNVDINDDESEDEKSVVSA